MSNDPSLLRLTAAIEDLTVIITATGDKIVSSLDDIAKAEVDLTAAVSGAATRLGAFTTALLAAIASGNQAAIAQAAQGIEAQVAILNQAVAANPVPPVPVPPAPAP
jgi:hypothetical protein